VKEEGGREGGREGGEGERQNVHDSHLDQHDKGAACSFLASFRFPPSLFPSSLLLEHNSLRVDDAGLLRDAQDGRRQQQQRQEEEEAMAMKHGC